MKKNILTTLILTSTLFLSATQVVAASPTPAMSARPELRQERRDNMLEQIADRVEARFARHQARLQNWIDRAYAHLTALEENGKDVTNARTAMKTAETSLAAASTLGEEAVAQLRAVTPDNWTAQRTDAIAARAAVSKAQVAYAQVVKDMKLALVELKKAQQ